MFQTRPIASKYDNKCGSEMHLKVSGNLDKTKKLKIDIVHYVCESPTAEGRFFYLSRTFLKVSFDPKVIK